MTGWPQSVERVAAFLRESGANARIEEFSPGTPTAEDAARAVGARLGQIVKSLVFRCDGRFFLVMVAGDRRADVGKVAAAAGALDARIATTYEVKEATGFAPGGVAPFPLPDVDAVFVDHGVFAHDVVWVGAGSARHLAALTPADLLRLARARPIDAVATA